MSDDRDLDKNTWQDFSLYDQDDHIDTENTDSDDVLNKKYTSVCVMDLKGNQIIFEGVFEFQKVGDQLIVYAVSGGDNNSFIDEED